MSIELLEKQLVEGPVAKAKCVNCANNTRGDKCGECMIGYFRGTEDLRDICRSLVLLYQYFYLCIFILYMCTIYIIKCLLYIIKSLLFLVVNAMDMDSLAIQ